MKFKIENPHNIEILNELFVKVEPSLPSSVENSVFYPKLQQLIQKEIFSFTKEQVDLRQDLLKLKDKIGEPMTYVEVKRLMEELSDRYNNDNNSVGIVYHIEVTRIDFGVPVHVIIKRDMIYVKKFVFRFRKGSVKKGTDELTQSGIPKSKKNEGLFKKLLGGE